MQTAILASSPDQNATVMASAGSGKTWLLITRLIRLLMNGVHPGSILAITFTRKAAAEMQTRLSERLYEFVRLDDDLLTSTLENIGIETNKQTLYRARHLYEGLLRCEHPVRTTTFHAFCQDILRHFPIEADIPPGFDMLDNGPLVEQESLDALFNEATCYPNDGLAQALDQLLTHCGSIYNTEKALKDFLQHRSDWWAFTQGQHDPAQYASAVLIKQLAINPEHHPFDDVFSDGFTSELQEFCSLLNKHTTKTNIEYTASISSALDSNKDNEERLNLIKRSFLTAKDTPLSRKETNTQARSMGESGQKRFLALHQLVCDKLLALLDEQRRHTTLSLSQAWFTAGTRLIHYYQKIKTGRRQLDFTDLEWKACQLLNNSDNAQWVQYKLDQRIKHLLVDEFQDTNPTQWRLILPLLQEMAASNEGRQHSVFLVGDNKQSIYRFRRADPHLFNAANDWLKENLQAQSIPLDVSWRSSPAIIDFINQLFMDGPLHERLQSFHTHNTHRKQLWGKVELLPLIKATEDKNEGSYNYLRNPLKQPRIIIQDERHYQEGLLIATRINKMIADKTPVGPDNKAHPLGFDDIIILVRNRTYCHHYERALRELGIPYLGASKNTLLDNLEIQDMLALLDTLITPYNNASLAVVLRSPLFDCSDDDLMFIASYVKQSPGTSHGKYWFKSLGSLTSDLPDDSALKRANDKLASWKNLAGQLPVHDLLDRIYYEGDVLSRYTAAFPEHLRTRVKINLTRFIELALEVDSGRYPSLPYFLSQLRTLHQHSAEAVEEPPATDNKGGVRIMTIHAAKGLEAPAVFLADSTKTKSLSRNYHALIDWPATANHPSHFYLAGKKQNLDLHTIKLIKQHDIEDQREETNLLYVALTRAKQFLFISGCIPNRGKEPGWYGMIADRFIDEDKDKTEGCTFEQGSPPASFITRHSIQKSSEAAIDNRLSQPVALPTHNNETTHGSTHPHDYQQKIEENNGLQKGVVIHRILELLTYNNGTTVEEVSQSIANEFNYDQGDIELIVWLNEATLLLNKQELGRFFNPNCYDTAINEVPIQYFSGDKMIYGIIDRLIIHGNDIILLDYKTHHKVTPDNIKQVAEPFRSQLDLYSKGVKLLWPDKNIHSSLLFTDGALLYDFN